MLLAVVVELPRGQAGHAKMPQVDVVSPVNGAA